MIKLVNIQKYVDFLVKNKHYHTKKKPSQMRSINQRNLYET